MMKKITALVFLLFSVGVYGQQARTTTVNLYLRDCNDKMAHWHSADTIVLHKLPEDTVERKLIVPSQMGNRMLKIQNLPVSKFRLTFKNSFGQTISKRINIVNKPSQTVEVCVDSLETYGQNTLAQLQVGDSIVINYNSSGCFHWAQEKMVLLKTSDGLVASLYDENGHTIAVKRRQTKLALPVLLNAKTLNDEQAAAFVRFENELGRVRRGGCTTRDQYKVESKYGRIEKIDGTCDWGGFGFLKEAFFGKQQ